ncbi:MAG: hypothetical protein QXU67_00450 [Candidatus Bathyarchaeia archaeon]
MKSNKEVFKLSGNVGIGHIHYSTTAKSTLEAIGTKFIRDSEPSEIITINKNGLKSDHFARFDRHAHCPFEYIYFTHLSSRIEGINVYTARKEYWAGIG